MPQNFSPGLPPLYYKFQNANASITEICSRDSGTLNADGSSSTRGGDCIKAPLQFAFETNSKNIAAQFAGRTYLLSQAWIPADSPEKPVAFILARAFSEQNNGTFTPQYKSLDKEFKLVPVHINILKKQSGSLIEITGIVNLGTVKVPFEYPSFSTPKSSQPESLSQGKWSSWTAAKFETHNVESGPLENAEGGSDTAPEISEASQKLKDSWKTFLAPLGYIPDQSTINRSLKFKNLELSEASNKKIGSVFSKDAFISQGCWDIAGAGQHFVVVSPFYRNGLSSNGAYKEARVESAPDGTARRHIEAYFVKAVVQNGKVEISDIVSSQGEAWVDDTYKTFELRSSFAKNPSLGASQLSRALNSGASRPIQSCF